VDKVVQRKGQNNWDDWQNTFHELKERGIAGFDREDEERKKLQPLLCLHVRK